MANDEPLLWLDMEMTGLDPDTCVILEIAAVVTDLDLRPLGEFHAVVHQPKEVLDRMDEWCIRTHGASGLTAAVATGTPLSKVEEDLVRFTRRHFPGQKPILCGNSIWQDRRFVEAHLRDFASILHYRMIDVSSYKEIFKKKYGIGFKKKETHRAVDDIHESIGELAHYLSYVQPSSGSLASKS